MTHNTNKEKLRDTTSLTPPNSVVEDHFKLTPDAKSVGKLFAFNMLANLAVGIGGAMIGSWGTVFTAGANIARNLAYVLGELYISNRLKKGKEVDEAVLENFRTAMMFAGFASNLGQMLDPTSLFSGIAGSLASLTYFGLMVADSSMGDEKKKTIGIANRIYDAQVEMEELKEQAKNDNLSPEKKASIEKKLDQKRYYIELASECSEGPEWVVSLLYNVKACTGITISTRAGFQVASGIKKCIEGDFVTGICEIVGGGAFTYGALKYADKQIKEVKDRKERLEKRRELFRNNDPSQWHANGSNPASNVVQEPQ